jgi:hypothetical protein
MGNSKIEFAPVKKAVLKIVFDHINSGHIAGKKIDRDTTPVLCEYLFNKLNTNTEILDYSPASFKRLDHLLVDYYKNGKQNLSDEEIVWLIREIAAYIGEIFMRNSNGVWVADVHTSLHSTRIKYSGDWVLLKENKKRKVSDVSYSPADMAISGWQSVLDNKKPNTGKMFKEIKGKLLVEEISCDKKYWPKE